MKPRRFFSFLYVLILLPFIVFPTFVHAAPWDLKGTVPLKFDAYHPQGLVKIGDRFFLSSVEVENKKAGKGAGYLFEFNGSGEKVNTMPLGEGAMYHPGGMDFDGSSIWVPVSEYREKSTSIIYKVDPDKWEAKEAFRVKDHIGAVVFNRETQTIVGMNWGSGAFYEWHPDGRQIRKVLNEYHTVAFQDCKYLSGPSMICAGVNQNAVGKLVLVDLIDFDVQQVFSQVPRTLKKILMTRNPMTLDNQGGIYRFYFLPEDHFGTMHVYENVFDIF
jgi:hypothetical protein